MRKRERERKKRELEKYIIRNNRIFNKVSFKLFGMIDRFKELKSLRDREIEIDRS